MNTLVDKKKYIVVGQHEYEKFLEKAAVKKLTARKLSLAEGKKLANRLIDKWHKEKKMLSTKLLKRSHRLFTL